MPLSQKFTIQKKFSKGVSYHLSHGKRVVFYPEQAMWYMYEKPRPFRDGAYFHAVKNNVPIIPMFTTFRHTGEFDEEGIEIKYLSVHIMPPIFPKSGVSDKENISYMRDLNFKMCKDKYEEIYGRKLEYVK